MSSFLECLFLSRQLDASQSRRQLWFIAMFQYFFHLCDVIYIHICFVSQTHHEDTAHWIWSVITPISKLNRLYTSLRVFLHIPLNVMGWLRLVGALKLQVSFAEYRFFYRALLQKKPIIFRSLLIVATQYLFSASSVRRTMNIIYILNCICVMGYFWFYYGIDMHNYVVVQKYHDYDTYYHLYLCSGICVRVMLSIFVSTSSVKRITKMVFLWLPGIRRLSAVSSGYLYILNLLDVIYDVHHVMHTYTHTHTSTHTYIREHKHPCVHIPRVSSKHLYVFEFWEIMHKIFHVIHTYFM